MTTGEAAVIEIADDGRGIDMTEVLVRAKAKGLSDRSSLDDAALLEILCVPGFSTRTEADRESGRGVGMDVVNRTVEALSGTLSLSTQKGKGTTFRIELPLTLAIADALVVAVSGETYAVPQAAVRQVIEVNSSDVRALEQNEIISYRESVLPLLRLSEFFRLPPKKQSSAAVFHVLISGTGTTAVGIVVDRILGHREIIVRAISDPLLQVPGIAGATDLGDERVVLILDVPSLRRIAFDTVKNAGV
jgi:two-component system chemotaxis sensor kinase CheA